MSLMKVAILATFFVLSVQNKGNHKRIKNTYLSYFDRVPKENK